MLSLHQAIEDGRLKADIALVLSSNKNAAGLARARARGLSVALVDRDSFRSRADFEKELMRELDKPPIDLLVLAGFMRMLSPSFVSHYANRIINIHPSLLPQYRGLNTHKRVLAAGDKEHGLTIHCVTAELDGGPIILQKKIRVEDGSAEEDLAEKLLQQEHIFLPLSVWLLSTGTISLTQNKVFLCGGELDKRGIRWDESNQGKAMVTQNNRLIKAATEYIGDICGEAYTQSSEQEQASNEKTLTEMKKLLDCIKDQYLSGVLK